MPPENQATATPVTLQDFQQDNYWRLIFDLAFGLGVRDIPAAGDVYMGPITNVEHVYSASKDVSGQQAGAAIVRWKPGTSPYLYSMVMGSPQNEKGMLLEYSEPPEVMA